MIKKFFKYKVVRIILWLHVIAIVIIVALVLFLTHSTSKAYQAGIKHVPYDAIIVPGYPYTGSWHDIMKTRVYWAAHLWQKGATNHIIFSGGAVYSPYVESIIMKQYAIKLGVPEEAIFTEKQAEHSTENLFYSYQIAQKQGFQKVALATDPVQSFFLTQYADNKAYNLGYLPIQYEILEAKELKDFSIDDKVAYIEDFEALPDRESFWTRMKGTLGGNIEYLEVE
ncbi:YdcF family protein [Fulvivirga sediminis]|uniref:YdcF family protein n=1 Tax=Fulvivirga sediminis TaxID=2803949 RepID=A0A937F886_9BACT|nr:YdcF family protein [Fulvivirga sediminis]MBL3656827.1 YdcF family protein [Fulvivirga sediminis]